MIPFIRSQQLNFSAKEAIMNFVKALAVLVMAVSLPGCMVSCGDNRGNTVRVGIPQQVVHMQQPLHGFDPNQNYAITCNTGDRGFISRNGQAYCQNRHGGGLYAPLRVQPVGGNGYGNAAPTHAGTVPMVHGRCPAGMGSAPRTPNQLPGCW